MPPKPGPATPPRLPAGKPPALPAPAAKSTGPGVFGQLADLVAVIVLVYLGCGIVFTIGLVFLGGGRVGAPAFSQASTYLVCLFWPYSLWVLLSGLAGLG